MASGTMKDILIVYATRDGQTQKVAMQISAHLQSAGDDVRLVDAKEKEVTAAIDIDSNDLVVFGASMHAGGLESELIDFVNRIAGALKYSRYPLPLKWMMSRIARKAGQVTDMSSDYEYTDWQQVEDYASRLYKMAI
jgi:menaquinone-dependent protoporphyrinogen oxidase